MRLKVLHVYRQSKRRTIKIRGYLLKFSASLYFWLGATDQFRSDKKWYWVQTEQNIKTGYSDWYRTEPDNPGTYIFYVFITRSYNPATYTFVSRFFTLLRWIIRVLKCQVYVFSLAVCMLMIKFVSFLYKVLYL